MIRMGHCLLFICIALAGCERPAEDFKVSDENAKLYRMYVEQADSELLIRQFYGQLRMADFEGIVGQVESLPQDAAGNRVSGWTLDNGLVWKAVASPSQTAVNLVTESMGGTTSSALDLDGDGVADIVDISLSDNRHVSFVTELGREIFNQWLVGRNPLCNDALLERLSITAFGCSGGGLGGGSSSGGTGGEASADPFDAICAQYRDSQRMIRPPVMADAGYGDTVRYSYTTSHWGEEDNPVIEGTRRYLDAEGNHVATYRTLTFYNSSREVVRVVNERVDSSGNGERTITDHGADGSTKTETETFEAEVDENGDYGPSPGEHERAPGADEAEPVENPNSDTSDPGTPPGTDQDVDMQAWCEATQPRESGLERAADTDPTAFGLGCDEIAFTASAAGNGDCRIFDWAKPEDFTEALEPGSPAGGCGPFEQPGPDGTCGAASGIERLKGRVAWFGSLALPEIDICNPLVCNPGDLDNRGL